MITNISKEYKDVTRSKVTFENKETLVVRVKIKPSDVCNEDRIDQMVQDMLSYFKYNNIELPKRVKGTFKFYKKLGIYKVILREEIVENGRTKERKPFMICFERESHLNKGKE